MFDENKSRFTLLESPQCTYVAEILAVWPCKALPDITPKPTGKNPKANTEFVLGLLKPDDPEACISSQRFVPILQDLITGKLSAPNDCSAQSNNARVVTRVSANQIKETFPLTHRTLPQRIWGRLGSAINLHHKPMNADEYVKHRLKPMIRFYTERLPGYNGYDITFTVLELLVTIVAAVLAFSSIPNWIAVCAVVETALLSLSGFLDHQKKLLRYSNTIKMLKDHLTWWNLLEVVEQSTAKNIDYLVDYTENAICAETEAWRATSSKNQKPRKDLDEDINTKTAA